MSRVVALRKERRESYEKDGIKLTFMAFILQAAAGALKEFPIMTGRLVGDNIELAAGIGVGFAVAGQCGPSGRGHLLALS
jgi:pyruvate/2-oxoglutarate dehydrogenase complex dihydrolipoamide acyltransferase (E2) component